MGLGLGKFFKQPSKLLGIEHRKNKEAAAAAAEAEAQRKTDEARAAALAQAEATAKQQREYQQSLMNMQREAQALSSNNASDLSNDASANIVVGGSADQQDNDALLKKRKTGQGTGMAAQLGINV